MTPASAAGGDAIACNTVSSKPMLVCDASSCIRLPQRELCESLHAPMVATPATAIAEKSQRTTRIGQAPGHSVDLEQLIASIR